MIFWKIEKTRMHRKCVLFCTRKDRSFALNITILCQYEISESNRFRSLDRNSFVSTWPLSVLPSICLTQRFCEKKYKKHEKYKNENIILKNRSREQSLSQWRSLHKTISDDKRFYSEKSREQRDTFSSGFVWAFYLLSLSLVLRN